MTIFRPFHNSAVPKNFCIQISTVEVKSVFRSILFKNFQQLDTPFLQVSTKGLVPIRLSLVHDFNVFAHFVVKN